MTSPHRSTPEALRARWLTPEGQSLHAAVSHAIAHGANWRATLRGLPYSSELGDNLGDLRGIDLTGRILLGAELRWARLEGARLDRAWLDDAKLPLANLSGASLTHTSLRSADLRAAVAVNTVFDRADLCDALLLSANLARASLRQTRLVGARLDLASLVGAQLLAADLRGASLVACDLEDAVSAGSRGLRPPPDIRGRDLFPSMADALPRYLSLLNNPSSYDLLWVEGSILGSLDPERELLDLLDQYNWRHGLIALAAVLVMTPPPSDTLWAAVWRAVEQSWVGPQAVATAWLRDPNFGPRATTALRHGTGRPLTRAALAELYPSLPDPDPGIDAEIRAALALFPGDTSGRGLVRRWIQRVREAAPPALSARWIRE